MQWIVLAVAAASGVAPLMAPSRRAEAACLCQKCKWIPGMGTMCMVVGAGGSGRCECSDTDGCYTYGAQCYVHRQ